MTGKLIYENKNLNIYYEEKGNYIVQVWEGATPGHIFEDLLSKVKDVLFTYKPLGVVLDTRNHKGIGPKGQKLAADLFLEYAKTREKLYNAIIVPEDIFSKISMENFEKHITDSPVTATKHFVDMEGAIEWIENL